MEEVNFIPDGSLGNHVGEKSNSTTSYVLFNKILKSFKKDVIENKDLICQIFNKSRKYVHVDNFDFIDGVYRLLDRMTFENLKTVFDLIENNQKKEAYIMLKWKTNRKKKNESTKCNSELH